MAWILLALDGKRLLNLFLLNRPVPPTEIQPYFQGLGFGTSRFLVKWIMIGASVYGSLVHDDARRYESEGVSLMI